MVLIIRFSMACPKLDFIVGPAILLYFATVITELVSSVPVGLLQNNFGGNCILFAKVTYFPNDTIKVSSFGSKNICEFCTYLTIFTTTFPLAYGGYSLYAICQTLENASQMWVLPALMLNFLLMVLKLISSSILSVGKAQLCSSISAKLATCSAGQSKPWFSDDTSALNGKNYHSYLTTAQSASWVCVFEWIFLLVLTILHYRRNITLRSSGSSVPVERFENPPDTAGVIENEFPPATSPVHLVVA